MNLKTIAGWVSKGNCPVIPLIYLVIPFSFLDTGLIHKGHKIGLLIGLLFILAANVPNRWLRWFFLYVATWHLITRIMVVFGDPFNLMLGKVAFGRMIFLMAGIALYLMIVNSGTPLKCFYNAICIGTLIQCGIAIFQKFDVDLVVWALKFGCEAQAGMSTTIGMGTLGNNNFLAAFIAISTPFFLRKRWAWCLFFTMPILFSLNTSTAVIALVAGMMVYFGLIKKTGWGISGSIGIIGVAICGIVYTCFIDSEPIYRTSWRFTHWWSIIQALWVDKTALVFGSGPGVYLPIAEKCPLHNEWLEGLYHYGLVGMSFLVAYLATVSMRNKILFTALIIACVNAIGNYPMHLAPSAFLILIIMGLIQRESHGRLSNTR